MIRRLAAMPAIAALSVASQAQLPVGAAELTTVARRSDSNLLVSKVENAEGAMFATYASLDPTFRGRTVRLGLSPLDANGTGEQSVQIPDTESFPPNTRVYLAAAYRDSRGKIAFSQPREMLFNATPVERIDFTYHPDGKRIEAGESIAEQWASLGVHIVYDSHAPADKGEGIAVDSTAPVMDTDLETPGTGLGNDDELDNVLVIANNMIDANQDGYVDQPEANVFGGIVEFRFDDPVYIDRLTLVDVDQAGSRVLCLDGPDVLARVDVVPTDDNGVQTILFPLEPITRLRVNLQSASGIGELSYLPCPEEIDFDHTMTGTPLGFRKGEIIGDQLRDSHGFRVKADTHHPTNDQVAHLIPMAADLKNVEGDSVVERRVLAVAAFPTDADEDGTVDTVGEEPLGGVLRIDFDFDVRWTSARAYGVGAGETGFFIAFDKDGNEIATIPLQPLGDDVMQKVQVDLSGVRQVRLNIDGTGGLAGFSYCAEAQPGNNP